jgi:hypothetical protein
MKSSLAFFVFVFLACQTASAREVSDHARKAVEAIQQLRSVGLPDFEDDHKTPRAKVPQLLRSLNKELRALIVEELNDASEHTPVTEEEIFDQLRAAGWEELTSQKWEAYGEIEAINFDWKVEYDPGVLVVTTKLWSPCGYSDPDSAIYVFQGAKRHWDVVLATESDFDAIGSSEESGMSYKLALPDSAGKWFLVVGYIPASCRKARPWLKYKALRPSSNPDQPTVVVSGMESVDSFFNPAFRIEAHEDWFAVTLGKTRKLDDEPGVEILRYELNAGGAKRIPPLALAPEDFLDQWVQMKWDGARQWAKESQNLAEWHEKLEKISPGSVEIEAIQKCSGGEDGDQEWLVEMAVDQPPNPTLGAEALYVGIAKRNGAFSVQTVEKTGRAGCSSIDLSAKSLKNELPSW